MSIYGEMSVEKRISTTAHGIKPPTNPGEPGFAEQLQDTVILCREASRADGIPWTKETIRVLEKWNPTKSKRSIPEIMENLGFNSWKEVCEFVKHDECPEFAVKMEIWAKKELNLKQDKGFIDGQGIGFYRDYLDELKVTLEKAFDIKWYYKAKRPLQYIYDTLGVDFSVMANYIHPAHNSFVAGHSVKFYTAASTTFRWYQF